MNFQSAGKVQKNDEDLQNEDAATGKEKKPATSMFRVSKFFFFYIL